MADDLKLRTGPSQLAVQIDQPPAAAIKQVGPLRNDLGPVSRVGLVAAALILGIGGGWAATAKLASAVIASGTVNPESTRQTIQHLEGGIVRQINVKDGTRVERGQDLIRMDDLGAKADMATISNRVAWLAAQEARLLAEQVGNSRIAFVNAVFASDAASEAGAAIEQETNRFNTRATALEAEKRVLRQRAVQLRAQMVGFETQLQNIRKQQTLFKSEIATAEEMVAKGLERRSRLLALQRSEADRFGNEGEVMANLARSKEAISELEFQITTLDTRRKAEIDTELADVRSRRAEAEEQLRKVQDRLERTVIRSPTNGVVLNVRFRTIGSVIKPSEPIMDIVPTDEGLVINARISPRNIDEVRPGMPAHVIFPSYVQRSLLRIDGQLRYVSADALQDERTGESYFLAKVDVDRAHLRRVAPQIEMQPGLPAEVYITTSDRTVLDYIVQPLRLSIERGMKEQ